MEAALHGAGVTMPSGPLAGEHLASGRFVSTPEPWCAAYSGFLICYPQHRTVSRSRRAVIDTTTAALRMKDAV